MSFVCKQCGEQFSWETNLKRHSAVHNLAISYPCSLCTFVSARKDSLKRHCHSYHNQVHDDDDTKFVSVAPTISSTETNVKHPGQVAMKKVVDSHPNDFFRSDSLDQRLQLPNNFIYAGASQSGKTTLLAKTLENASKIYNPAPTRVLFLYSCYQNNYSALKEQLTAQGIECLFHKASVITEDELEAIADPNGGQTLIIIDDNSIAAASSKEMAQVFTVARHKNCSMVLLLHFIFGPWPSSRIISANTSYYFLLKSPRMLKQISTLGAQLQKQTALVSAYERETKKNYGYILLDLCTATPEHMRLRSNIFDEIVQSGSHKMLTLNPKTARNGVDKTTQTDLMEENKKKSGKINTSKFAYVPWD